MRQEWKALKLDDLNIVNIEGEDDVNIIPRLHPHLEFIAKKPAVYPLNEIKKLVDDRKEGGRKVAK
jgi:hypothetical protein